MNFRKGARHESVCKFFAQMDSRRSSASIVTARIADASSYSSIRRDQASDPVTYFGPGGYLKCSLPLRLRIAVFREFLGRGRSSGRSRKTMPDREIEPLNSDPDVLLLTVPASNLCGSWSPAWPLERALGLHCLRADAFARPVSTVRAPCFTAVKLRLRAWRHR
jgi:hypothetical protein